MFETVFHGFAAFQQVGMILAGSLCILIGGLLFGNGLYWQFWAERVEGTIIGVKQQGVFFYPVYRYTVPSTGEEIEATSDSGTSSPAGMETGKTVALRVFAAKPHEARKSGSPLFIIIGLFFMMPGFLFAYIALTTYPVNGFTFMALIGFALYAGVRIAQKIKPGATRPTLADFRKRIASPDKLGNIPIKRIEEYAASPEGQAALALQRKNAKFATPILFVFGIALLGGGGYLTQKMQHLLTVGLRAPGQVTSIESSSGTDSTSYYARVTYRDASGVEHNFKDSVGSSHPFYSTGDDVNVVYLQDDPDKSAAIERGWKNWIAPFGLMGFGFILLLCGLSNLKTREKAL